MTKANGPRQSLTLRDIASAANVSIAAVSQALNDTGNLHPDTRSRIRAIASDLGYVPNKYAASLRKGRTMSIGFVAHTGLEPDAQKRWANYYGLQLNSLVQAAAEHGFTVTVIPDSRPELVGIAQVDAVYAPDARFGESVVAEARRRQLAIVTHAPSFGYEHAIRVDNGILGASRSALDTLAASGATKVGLLTRVRESAGDDVGEQLYRDWCNDRGQEAAIAHVDPAVDDLPRHVLQLLRSGVDGIYSYVEHGPRVYIELEQHGYVVPRDVQLIALCIDECSLNRRLGISHVCVRPGQAPALVINSLVELITTGTVAKREIELTWQYTAGSTTRPGPRSASAQTIVTNAQRPGEG